MKLFSYPATSLEYRGRVATLFGAQPVLAWTAFQFGHLQGVWYAPEVPAEIGIWASVLAVTGLLIRIQAASHFSSVRVARPEAETDEIVSSGPFGAVRNPLYVGSLFVFAGYALCFGIAALLIFLPLLLWRYQRLVIREESLLRNVWQHRFDQYCQRVPRWLPLRPWQLFGGNVWSLQALLVNGPFIGLGFGILASAAYGTLLPVIPLEAAGFAAAGLHFLLRPASARVTPRQTSANPRPSSASTQAPVRGVPGKP